MQGWGSAPCLKDLDLLQPHILNQCSPEQEVPVLIHKILSVAVMDDEQFPIGIVGHSNTALDPCIVE